MGQLADKVVLITGAARGTGRVTARSLAEAGARVVLADVRDELGQATAEEIGEAATYQHLDVRSEQDWQRVVGAVVDRFGRIDVLVNNAAVLHWASIEETEVDDFDRVVAVNQRGPLLGIKTVIDPMRRAGGGAIVNIASVDGVKGNLGRVVYASTKWALRGITRVAALELGPFGIRVNVVCPSLGSAEMIESKLPPGVDAEAVRASGERVLPALGQRNIEDRLGDISRMVVFLASDESASCTGADFVIDGGLTVG
jgi:3alpha(or 20beta)-hydroxysteroid dehydrogenase